MFVKYLNDAIGLATGTHTSDSVANLPQTPVSTAPIHHPIGGPFIDWIRVDGKFKVITRPGL